ncbi:segregation and condensation protein A [Oleiphilus messinensis]|uniref:segregation and condensation protein A n=1 Tax=Oceanospirillum linum TaxID=966 RepID=UPI00089F4764|nr:condensin subunit ScpA [Oleiphilus messinensis]SMP06690.1 condensin subunit ScpA [Oceanospirillum linum]
MSIAVEPEQLDFWARIGDETVTEPPQDLYIPPEALRVFLEAFEGPLDLLLYLIRRQNLDILSVNVAEITRQYMEYVDLMRDLQIELAGEYLVMAALLAEIKSRSLLPRQHEELEDEDDPTATLLRRLQEYEQLKEASEKLDALPRVERDVTPVQLAAPEFEVYRAPPEVDLQEILMAMAQVVQRAELQTHHHIELEPLSTRERMSQILDSLTEDRFYPFESLFTVEEGRMGVVVTFLAMMELIKARSIELVQNEPFSPIHVRPRILNGAESHGLLAIDGELEEGDAGLDSQTPEEVADEN